MPSFDMESANLLREVAGSSVFALLVVLGARWLLLTYLPQERDDRKAELDRLLAAQDKQQEVWAQFWDAKFAALLESSEQRVAAMIQMNRELQEAFDTSLQRIERLAGMGPGSS